VYYCVHVKRGAPPEHPKTLRIDYQIGFNDYKSEWVCPAHPPGSYARGKFETWWRARSNEPCPDTAEQAVAIGEAGGIAQPSTITVRSVTGEKFDRITQYQLGPIPPRLDGSEERDDGNLPAYDWAEDEVPF